ncbi:Serine protease precursor MucD/AlgY [Caenispirillum salinarum AK4]|uniref:Serine protease MucD/AlgY n=1 Tax=Caenispirillum salinarum AK4 TaxID=1238182 RepID=K9H5A8_9PROT|nr:serine protease [Caenispirillum salinarum]EKV32742.1 Serine protease precursor MucD/AlgY [Caenispirillum salinarum AK4]
MPIRSRRSRAAALILALAAALPTLLVPPAQAQDRDLRSIVQRMEPAVVAVGTFQPSRHPPVELMGTGFGIGDGSMVLTNAHVLPRMLDHQRRERIAVIRNKGDGSARDVEVITPSHVCRDDARDLALLVLGDRRLPAAVGLDVDAVVDPGLPIAFTGYPLSSAVGLHPVTHRGMVSAVAPAAVPMADPKLLDPAMLERLRNNFDIYQLDATAYPGNSGSPLYDQRDGRVIGILNSVYVKSTRERQLSAISEPSGITYAIPIRFAQPLIERARNGGCRAVGDRS